MSGKADMLCSAVAIVYVANIAYFLWLVIVNIRLTIRDYYYIIPLTSNRKGSLSSILSACDMIWQLSEIGNEPARPLLSNTHHHHDVITSFILETREYDRAIKLNLKNKTEANQCTAN